MILTDAQKILLFCFEMEEIIETAANLTAQARQALLEASSNQYKRELFQALGEAHKEEIMLQLTCIKTFKTFDNAGWLEAAALLRNRREFYVKMRAESQKQ